ncbi:MAG TPA: phosphate ABC transporter permease PstA [Thermoanaerobaculia bacterium]|nr:phosphate ABC transporter permease PstA [Thermoanaerobaculia bacterium]HXK66969.1 phosphate ABC transporter permease PstA [Thermoanaerobaculia bacterium]
MIRRWVRWEERFFVGLMIGATLLIALTLLSIVGTIVIKGLPAMSLDMVLKTPRGGFYLGKEGGILNAILGSLFLTGGSTLLALGLSLPVALYLNLYARKGSPTAHLVRLALDLLWGVPSIVYGAFGFTLMIAMGMKASLLAGIITVTLLIIPIMARAMDEVISMVPTELVEASLSLGATRLETALRVVVRQAFPGLLSAVLIAAGRGVGDAASVLFTAGFSDAVPSSLLDPVATLPLAIFFQLGTPFPEVQQRAYASAMILTILILLLSGSARWISRRWIRHVVK